MGHWTWEFWVIKMIVVLESFWTNSIWVSSYLWSISILIVLNFSFLIFRKCQILIWPSFCGLFLTISVYDGFLRSFCGHLWSFFTGFYPVDSSPCIAYIRVTFLNHPKPSKPSKSVTWMTQHRIFNIAVYNFLMYRICWCHFSHVGCSSSAHPGT